MKEREPSVETARTLPSGRRVQLDALRLVAILGVLFDHGGLSEWFKPGLVGVRFFLLLSGFLITRTLVSHASGPWRESAPVIRRFYAKRALRIWPLYYAILVVLLVAGEIKGREALIHGLFVTNFAQALANNWHVTSWFLPHLWTICVQEQFYLVWPLLFVVISPAGRIWALAIMFGSAVVFRAGMWLAGLEDQIGFYTLPPASFDALAVGSLLAIGQARLRARLTNTWLIVAAAAALALALAGLADGFVPVALVPTLWLLPLSVLVLCTFDGRLGPLGVVLGWPPLVFLGRISLGIYLLHLPMALALNELGPRSLMPLLAHKTWSAFAINTSATVIAAVLSWFLFERPLQGLRRYLDYERPGSRQAADPA